jgi:hypothetical protein
MLDAYARGTWDRKVPFQHEQTTRQYYPASTRVERTCWETSVMWVQWICFTRKKRQVSNIIWTYGSFGIIKARLHFLMVAMRSNLLASIYLRAQVSRGRGVTGVRCIVCTRDTRLWNISRAYQISENYWGTPALIDGSHAHFSVRKHLFTRVRRE